MLLKLNPGCTLPEHDPNMLDKSLVRINLGKSLMQKAQTGDSKCGQKAPALMGGKAQRSGDMLVLPILLKHL